MLTISKKDLVRLLTRCQGIATKKSHMPALSSVLLTAAGTALNVAATDTFMVVTDSAPAEVEKPVSCGVPAKDTLARVALMPDGPLKISVDAKGAMTIKSGGSSPRKFTFQTIPAADFPDMPGIRGDAPKVSIVPSELTRLIELVKLSISPDETVPHLNSALFEWTEDRVRMVSTNGRMLSIADHAVEGDVPASMLVPLRAISEVQKLVAGATEPIAMRPVGSRLFFDVGTARLGVNLVDGQFPPYMQVVPKLAIGTIRVERAALNDAMAGARLVVGVAKPTCLTIGKGSLRVSGEGGERGDVVDELAAEGWTSAAQDVGVDAQYVIETLSAMSCDAVTIGFGGPLDPVVVKPDGRGDHVAVIMPMKLALGAGVARG